MTRAYAIVVRRVRRNYSADCPDLPGCVATGRTVDETLRRMRSALRLHIDGLRARRLPVPRPTTKLAALVRERAVEQIYTVLRIAA